MFANLIRAKREKRVGSILRKERVRWVRVKGEGVSSSWKRNSWVGESDMRGVSGTWKTERDGWVSDRRGVSRTWP